MILPTKGISSQRALITIGAQILRELDQPKTVSRLWSELPSRKSDTLDISFDWFVLALDVLFTMGVIDYYSGRIHRVQPSGATS